MLLCLSVAIHWLRLSSHAAILHGGMTGLKGNIFSKD